MVETHWDDLRDSELRYQDRTWKLTGDVEVTRSGGLLALDAQRVDGSRRESATLYFDVADPPDSINPANADDHFHRVERSDGDYHVVVKAPGRTYRYELGRIEYD